MKKIGLLWHSYPSENLGCSALSHSHILLLDQAARDLGLPIEYFVAGIMPEADVAFSDLTATPATYRQFSLSSFAKRPSTFRQMARDLGECAIVFDLSEGDSFADIYGWKRFVAQTLSKSMVLARKAPLVLGPQTIGPFDRWYGAKAAGQVMKRCRRVFARDNLSYDYACGLAGPETISTTIDVAFALPYDREPSPSIDHTKVNVGLNVSGLLYNGGYSGGNGFGLVLDYRDFTQRFLSHFAKMDGVAVHLTPHVISDFYAVEDDLRVGQQLADEFPEVIVAPRFASPVEAKSYISNMDFYVGARMHATIAAYSAGVPVVPCAYSRKFAGLYGSLGHKHLIEGSAHSADDAMRIVQDAFGRRDEIREETARGNVIAQQRLDDYRKFLRVVLEETCRA